jgi:predicted RNA binding protein YcfA (HicA-like mRNA interferase family)
MSKFEKDLAKLKQNPKNVHFEELEKILLRFGFTKRQRGSSHAVFTKGKNVLTVPIKRPFLKSVYVRQALAVIEDMIDLDEQEGNKGVK